MNWGTMLENYSKCRNLIFGIFTNFCRIESDLSSNTFWPQGSGFQKLAEMDPFLAFLIDFCLLKM